MKEDDYIDKIIKFFLQPVILIELGVGSYSFIGVEAWWAIALSIITPLVIVNIKPLYITVFVSLSIYLTYIFGLGSYEKGGVWVAGIVGFLTLTICLCVHAYAFLDLNHAESKNKECEKEEECINEKQAS